MYICKKKIKKKLTLKKENYERDYRKIKKRLR